MLSLKRYTSIIALCIACIHVTSLMGVVTATAVPKVALGIKTTHPRKTSETLSRGGDSRGGASTVAIKTMPARQMKLLNILSGGVAGTIASCITNPLEVIKTQLQSSSISQVGHPIDVAKRVMAVDGVAGFFKGLKPTLIGIIPARSIYFYSYETTKRKLGSSGILPEGSDGNAILSGFMAGWASNTLTNPIWMVKTRVQLLADHTAGQRVYNSYRDAVSTIMKEEGIGGFYRGISASYWGCAEGAVQFLFYERIKARLLIIENERLAEEGLPPTDKLPKAKYFFSAAFAKGVASMLTYPHEVARTRLREQARSGIFKYNGMWNTIGIIAKEEGRSGLYAGMGVHMSKVVPNSAIMFLTYEVVNSWLSGFKAVE